MDTDELVALIAADVEAALNETAETQRTGMLSRLAMTTFDLAYEDITGEDVRTPVPAAATFVASMAPAFGLLVPDGTESQDERMARVIAHAALNAATAAAASPESKLEWRTMRDDRVRDLHQPMDGQLRAAGDPFDVGGHSLLYPGQPVGPPEVWINCRCTLIPATSATAAADALVARTYSAEQRRQMANRGTAMPDGSFPIADEEDLRNAIQAIGRAKDPDKAKAHIRKRARALGKSDLIPESWSSTKADGELVAASSEGESALVAVNTHDAPGWITNPRETQRLRTYWTRGEGAAKIRWGQGGDFNRCRKQLAKYIPNPEFLAGTCANLHYVALGFWPSTHAKMTRAALEGDPVTAAFLAAADLDEALPPIEMFQAPPLTAATPVTITDDDEFTAHLATWDTCHVGISGGCTTPPHSTHGYAYFQTGEMLTAGGPVPVGQITMDTGHAGTDLGPNETVRHYDDTGTVVADVAAGEDDHGIWVHGMLRPGITPEQRRALRAGSLSGDWRRIGGNLELVAALVVNVPGFPIPRPQLAASAAGVEMALVAAAIVDTDPNAVDIERIAIAVVDRLDARDRRVANAGRVAVLRSTINADRVAHLVAAVEE